jgi:hypothetical protein
MIQLMEQLFPRPTDQDRGRIESKSPSQHSVVLE